MVPLAQQIDVLSIMRLDGDSTNPPSVCCTIFRENLALEGTSSLMTGSASRCKRHAPMSFVSMTFNPGIIPIDKFAVYWKQTEEKQVQFWRYKTSAFT